MTIFVLNKEGEPMMPTTRPGRMRHLLNDGKAVIVKHRPFTIQLLYNSPNYRQPIEFCCDTGDHHIGVSLKSEAKEYLSDEYRPLEMEKQRHDDCRKLRKTRRSKKRYRAKRLNNRKNRKGKLPPSVEHKVDVNLKAFTELTKVCPITQAVFEVGAFDTQLLAAIEKGDKKPEGEDYQRGPRYNFSTLREAVFARDGYRCRICGKGVGDKGADKKDVILRLHHALFWMDRHGDQMDELITCCTNCHTPANHKKGGILYGYTPQPMKSYAGAATMNQMRWRIVNKAKEIAPDIPIRITYGANTKAMRKFLGLEKSHVNDAYAMGDLHPEKRAEFRIIQKVRRNNRILEKFYDAWYIDARDSKKHKGSELFSGRTCRNKNLNGENLHQYRGKKVSKGKRTIRRKHYPIRPKDRVRYKGKTYFTSGCQSYGTRIVIDGTAVSVKNIQVVSYANGWYVTSA